MGRVANLFSLHDAQLRSSWKHAKKKDGESENGVSERSGQEPPAPDNEKGPSDQESEAPVTPRFIAFTNEFLEVVLKNQADILEQLVVIAESMSAIATSLESKHQEPQG